MGGIPIQSTLPMALGNKQCKLRNQEIEPKKWDTVGTGLPGNLFAKAAWFPGVHRIKSLDVNKGHIACQYTNVSSCAGAMVGSDESRTICVEIDRRGDFTIMRVWMLF